MVLMCSVALWSQSQNTGSDPGNQFRTLRAAPVPGAQVKVTQTETGVTRAVVTESDGGYVLPNLPIGHYRLEVSKAGFSHLRSNRHRVAGGDQSHHRRVAEDRRRQ